MNRLPDPEYGVPYACTWDWFGSRFNWRHCTHPYVKSVALRECPTNDRAWAKTTTQLGANTIGDEANPAYLAAERVPAGYAYGGYFHENAPFCTAEFAGASGSPRPRTQTEIQDAANLIFLLESNLPTPDVGHWGLQWVRLNGLNVFHTHGGKTTVLTFADGHTKAMRLARTVGPRQMWTDNPADQPRVDAHYQLVGPLPGNHHY